MAHHHRTPDDLDDLLDLEAEVLRVFWSGALARVRRAAAGSTRARILDLGAGTGTGSIGLAEHFRQADVLAVDVSTDALARLRAKALNLGLAPRIRTLRADLDATWPEVGGAVDLSWASMSLHHLADPGRVLRDLHSASRPGGLLAVTEFADPLRLLPHDVGIGRPGLEDRLLEAFAGAHPEVTRTVGAAWAARLAGAGWDVLEQHDFTIDLSPAATSVAGRYARGWFTRLSHHLGDRLDPEDRTTLRALLEEHGPQALLRRTDLHIRGTRTLTLARRP